jgi:Na+-translocating ferredoxin:NAD+ oxidoreductase RnfG subunit
MPCDCCCEKTLDLCRFPVCGELDLGITAQQEGVHILVVNFLDVQFSIPETFGIGEKIVFPLDKLNENYVYQNSKLFEPDGKQVIIKKDDVQYDCFTFQTCMSFEIASTEIGSS